ncbi:MAG: hypothetical protein ABSC20_09625 [Candidatus Bathyarchaeia archaeon]|jgi:hypothetical protein
MSFKADVWTTAYINDLPDSAFAVIEPGGKKDSEGKTVPSSLRHLPYKGKSGKVDLPHLRNALARLSQTKISPELKEKARVKLVNAAKDAGVETSLDEKKSMLSDINAFRAYQEEFYRMLGKKVMVI